MPALPSGTVTFLFTDVERSTRLLERHPEAYRSAITQHHTILREAVEQNHGAVFETVSDAVYAAFASPGDAVAAALRARRPRFLPVVVDGWALARATRECATIMRGGWRTIALVHTPRDRAERLTLEGVREVAEAIAGVLQTRVDGPGSRV